MSRTDLQSCEADWYSSAGENEAGGGAVRAHASFGELLLGVTAADTVTPLVSEVRDGLAAGRWKV